ncbi:B12-binding domain-containing radical SAM protein [Lachnospiraceae bacterium ZAX-1]
MSCILLNSPIYWNSTDANEEYLPPIGLGYIATQLLDSNIEVEIVDCVKLQLGVNEVISILADKKPAYIGINIFTQNYDIVKHIAENCPAGSSLIIGGQVVKHIYLEILAWPIKNKLMIIIGEGELVVPAIIKGNATENPLVAEGDKKVYIVNQDSVYFPRDLSKIHLSRTFLGKEIIKNHYGRSEAAIITSRGCMYDCAFCGGARSLNKDIAIRIRTPEDITLEISEIGKVHPSVTYIRILDDLFLRNRDSIKDAINLFNQFPSLSWRGMAHALSFVNSLDLMDGVFKSGCNELFIGIESGSDKIRKKINKVGNIEQVVSTIAAILNAGIDVKGYFIYGFPTETLEDFDMTFSLASKLKLLSKSTVGNFRCSVFQFRPYHGTKLYKEILQSGHLIKSVVANTNINVLPNRSQFNFQSGNYSEVNSEILEDYILRTQRLSEEKYND